MRLPAAKKLMHATVQSFVGLLRHGFLEQHAVTIVRQCYQVLQSGSIACMQLECNKHDSTMQIDNLPQPYVQKKGVANSLGVHGCSPRVLKTLLPA